MSKILDICDIKEGTDGRGSGVPTVSVYAAPAGWMRSRDREWSSPNKDAYSSSASVECRSEAEGAEWVGAGIIGGPRMCPCVRLRSVPQMV